MACETVSGIRAVLKLVAQAVWSPGLLVGEEYSALSRLHAKYQFFLAVKIICERALEKSAMYILYESGNEEEYMWHSFSNQM